MKMKILRGCLCVLLGLSYLFMMAFGFLSGMLSEGLIGSVHPMANLLADVMVWLGLVISLSSVVCPLASLRMKKPVLRTGVLAIPFLLLAVQMVLGGIANML